MIFFLKLKIKFHPKDFFYLRTKKEIRDEYNSLFTPPLPSSLFMKVAIYGRNINDADVPYLQSMFDLLEKKKMETVVDEDFLSQLNGKIKFKNKISTFKKHSELIKSVDCLFSIGGDGTLLDTVSLIRDSNIPIMGINIGRLGFLATIQKKDIASAIDALEEGTFILDKRSLIHLDSNLPLFEGVNYGLNDFAILKRDTSATIVIHTYLNGEFLCSYISDGLIIATPTGSTGYNLSCGGPIIFPNSENFVITPIAPHNLNVRPLIVPDSGVISFEIEGRTENFLCTLDSRFETINASYQLAVKKENFTISLLRLPDNNFLNTIRNKLMWGADSRN